MSSLPAVTGSNLVKALGRLGFNVVRIRGSHCVRHADGRDADINEGEWLGAVARNPAFEFLRESAEDVYTVRDGKPFNNQG